MTTEHKLTTSQEDYLISLIDNNELTLSMIEFNNPKLLDNKRIRLALADKSSKHEYLLPDNLKFDKSEIDRLKRITNNEF